MAGVELPIGINTVNAVDADYKRGPWPSIAAGKAAIPLALRYNNLSFYVTGDPNEYYWLDTDLSDSGLLSRSSSASGLPKVRYVYLVQDASDAILMGGSATNVYTTFQAAYAAANTIQLALGGANKVVIQVGNTTAATVGNLSIATVFNPNITIVGLNRTVSAVGTMTTTAVSGNSTIRIQDCSVGIITSTSATANTLNITLIQASATNILYSNPTLTLTVINSSVGVITPSGTATGLTVTNSSDSTISSISQTATTTNTVTITWSSCSNVIVNSQNLTTSTGSVGNMIITGCLNSYFGIITLNNSGTIAGVVVGQIFVNGSRDVAFGNITMTATLATSGTIGGLVVDNITTATFSQDVLIRPIPVASDVVVTNFDVNNSIFDRGIYVNHPITTKVNSPNIGGRINKFSMRNCTVGTRTRVGYNLTTASGVGTFLIANSHFIGTGVSDGLAVGVENFTFSSLGFRIEDSVFSDTNVGIHVYTLAVAFQNLIPDSIIIENVKSTFFYIDYTSPETGEDMFLIDCNIIEIQIRAETQNSTFVIRNSNVDLLFFLDVLAAGVFTLSCSIVNSRVGLFLQTGSAFPPVDVRASSLTGTLEDFLTHTFNAYTSTLDFTQNPAGVPDVAGTLYTSNLLLPPGGTQTVTNNNSYIA